MKSDGVQNQRLDTAWCLFVDARHGRMNGISKRERVGQWRREMVSDKADHEIEIVRVLLSMVEGARHEKWVCRVEVGIE